MSLENFKFMLECFAEEEQKEKEYLPPLRYLYDSPGQIYIIHAYQYPILFVKNKWDGKKYQYNMQGRHVAQDIAKLMEQNGDKTPVGYKLKTVAHHRMRGLCKLQVEK